MQKLYESEERTCLQCGEHFKADGWAIHNNRGKYCSTKCFHKVRGDPPVLCSCGICGKEFYVQASRVKRGFGRFCSRQHAADWKKSKRITRICEICGNKFRVTPFYVKKGWGRFCSLKCVGVGHGFSRGENHPNWNNGSSFEPYCPKCNKGFKERVRVFWGRRCFWCGKTEDELHRKSDVHHVNYDKMVCCNDVIPLFITLCQKCNRMVNFNREMWEAYFTEQILLVTDGKSYYTTEEYQAITT